MDNILEACFNEDLFTTPLCHSKQKKEKKIESRNPWKYVNKFEPIYKAHKVTKEEVATLACRATHEIAPRDTNVSKNDMLYHYFATLCSQDTNFVRTWLHLFVRLHKQYFNLLAATYLNGKGLTLDNCLNSMHDGHKGDVLDTNGVVPTYICPNDTYKIHGCEVCT